MSALTSKCSRLVLIACAVALPVFGQQTETSSRPVIVQPGAPGKDTKVLPASTRPSLPPRSKKDVEFMQGMIMHHAQAVEMTDMIESRTADHDIRLMGARISKSQTDEMDFMRRWLQLRGEPLSMQMRPASNSDAHAGHTTSHTMLMPGMLSPKQMEALSQAKGRDFDRLFLAGMIQHHEGALVMVKELFDTAGAGQDAEIFNFATDVDSGQRAEINTMKNLSNRNHVEKKP